MPVTLYAKLGVKLDIAQSIYIYITDAVCNTRLYVCLLEL